MFYFVFFMQDFFLFILISFLIFHWSGIYLLPSFHHTFLVNLISLDQCFFFPFFMFIYPFNSFSHLYFTLYFLHGISTFPQYHLQIPSYSKQRSLLLMYQFLGTSIFLCYSLSHVNFCLQFSFFIILSPLSQLQMPE